MTFKNTLALSAVLLQSSFAAIPIDVYVLSGQSNMSGRVSTGYEENASIDNDVLYYYTTDGPASNDVTTNGSYTTLAPLGSGYYGPEISFAREVYTHTENKVAIIKITDGGTKLQTDWNSRNTSGNALWNTWLEDTEQALKELEALGYTPHIKGLSWLQGEGDGLTFASNGGYEAAFENLIYDMTSHLSSLAETSELKVVTALIQARTEKHTYTRAAQTNVMELNDSWYTVDTNHLTTSDGTHFDEPSVATLGELIAGPFISDDNSESQTIFASEDTYVRGGAYAGFSYGSESSVLVKTSSNAKYTRRSYIKFDVSNLDDGTASLIIHPTKVPAAGIEISLYTSDDDWSEESLNWNNQPQSQTLLHTFDVLPSDKGGSLSIDVTDYVLEQSSEDGIVSFAIQAPSSSGVLGFSSKEGGLASSLEFESHSQSLPQTVSANEDSYVRGGSFSTQNYGSLDHLRLKYNSKERFVRDAYVKFNVEGGATIQQANLILPILSNSGTGEIEVFAVNDTNWSESTIQWENKPAIAQSIATFSVGSTSVGQNITVDVTDYISNSNSDVVSFCFKALSGSASVIRIGSSESGVGPVLEIR